MITIKISRQVKEDLEKVKEQYGFSSISMTIAYITEFHNDNYDKISAIKVMDLMQKAREKQSG